MNAHYSFQFRNLLPFYPCGRKRGIRKIVADTYLLPPLLPLLPKREIIGKGGIEGAGKKVQEVAVEVVRW